MKKLQTLLSSSGGLSSLGNTGGAVDDRGQNQGSTLLSRCIYCGQLYTSEQNQWMMCANAKIFIDFHGQVIA